MHDDVIEMCVVECAPDADGVQPEVAGNWRVSNCLLQLRIATATEHCLLKHLDKHVLQ